METIKQQQQQQRLVVCQRGFDPLPPEYMPQSLTVSTNFLSDSHRHQLLRLLILLITILT
jgi:hypothetical protein